MRGLRIVYSPVNQAFFLMWYGAILSIHATRYEAEAEMADILRD